MDHIFVLHALSEIAKPRKKLFCLFIDFGIAFDSVWRDGLWKKLLANNINGKCFQIIFNMYKGINHVSHIMDSNLISSQVFEA